MQWRWRPWLYESSSEGGRHAWGRLPWGRGSWAKADGGGVNLESDVRRGKGWRGVPDRENTAIATSQDGAGWTGKSKRTDSTAPGNPDAWDEVSPQSPCPLTGEMPLTDVKPLDFLKCLPCRTMEYSTREKQVGVSAGLSVLHPHWSAAAARAWARPRGSTSFSKGSIRVDAGPSGAKRPRGEESAHFKRASASVGSHSRMENDVPVLLTGNSPPRRFHPPRSCVQTLSSGPARIEAIWRESRGRRKRPRAPGGPGCWCATPAGEPPRAPAVPTGTPEQASGTFARRLFHPLTPGQQRLSAQAACRPTCCRRGRPEAEGLGESPGAGGLPETERQSAERFGTRF